MFSVVVNMFSVVIAVISFVLLLNSCKQCADIEKINKENELLRIQLKYREKIIDLLKKEKVMQDEKNR